MTGKTFHSDKDVTTYTDKSLPSDTEDWPWSYKIAATSSDTTATPTYSNSISVSPIGGPDVTAHLIAIRDDLTDRLIRDFALQHDLHTDLSIVENPLGQAGQWDITKLGAQGVTTPHNAATLPNGQITVTVQGKVFDQAEVNYFLYGLACRLAGVALGDGALNVAGWREWNWLKNGDPAPLHIPGRIAWFAVGYTGNWHYADKLSDFRR